jgi:tRNA-Thr(GGU) m(6)t(6)A37 methyltransferase TsaA
MKVASSSSFSATGEIRLRPIGVVASPFRTVDSRCDYATEARVRLHPEFTAGLTGIEYFSHLWVIYHQHCADAWLRARGWNEARPLVIPCDDERAGQGIFSSRAPCRPAALGSCIVELVRREGAALIVRGLDAIDGTPVLDVKPYVPAFDAFPAAVVPLHWAKVMARADDPAHGSRAFHWDTTNADFALGQRAGLAALGQLGGRRGDALRAEVHGSLFVAQGFEMATGCSPLRGTLVFAEAKRGSAGWIRMSDRAGRMCRFVLTAGPWPDAVAVFAAKDAELWTISSGAAGAT